MLNGERQMHCLSILLIWYCILILYLACFGNKVQPLKVRHSSVGSNLGGWVINRPKDLFETPNMSCIPSTLRTFFAATCGTFWSYKIGNLRTISSGSTFVYSTRTKLS